MKYVNLFLIFGLVFVLLFSGCVSNQKEETIKIAAILPLTESAAYYGLQAQKGIELAKDELVKDGKYEIYYENSYYTPKGAVEGYTSSKSLRNLDASLPWQAMSRWRFNHLQNKTTFYKLQLQQLPPHIRLQTTYHSELCPQLMYISTN
jgi:hypothetical protein